MGMVVFFMMAIIFGIALLACLYEWLFGKNKNSNSLSTPVQNADKKLCCSNCGGDNIQVSVSVVNQVIGSTREVREKDGITRTANHIGRGVMNVMTLGMWSLTPKRSDYKETENVRSRNIQYKTAVCQTCGHSWNL